MFNDDRIALQSSQCYLFIRLIRCSTIDCIAASERIQNFIKTKQEVERGFQICKPAMMEVDEGGGVFKDSGGNSVIVDGLLCSILRALSRSVYL